jgi:hypothetical protein
MSNCLISETEYMAQTARSEREDKKVALMLRLSELDKKLRKSLSKPKPKPLSPTAAESVVQKSMTDFFSKYKLGRKLGEGAFGAVNICYLISDKNKTEYALKILNK